ncbi:MAG: membrane protein insertion efficiency factor YidD [Candidatus Binatia bacterium]
MNRFASRVVSLILVAYHRFVSPLLPRSCRFFPSCSIYASEAIRKYGVLRGSSLALRRLSSCHPWNPGGFDPLR